MAKRKYSPPAILEQTEKSIITADSDLSGLDYIKKYENQIVQAIKKIADAGTKEDEVRLKALKILLDKVVADERKAGIQFDGKSPYEVILGAIKLKYDK